MDGSGEGGRPHWSPVDAGRAAAVSLEALDVSLGGAAPDSDLGGSSKYLNENFEGRSREGFQLNVGHLLLRDGEVPF